MLPETLVTWTPPALGPSDTIEDALGQLLEEGVGVLPVVHANGTLLGIVTERMMLEADSPEATVSSVTGAAPMTVTPSTHVFEATKIMVQHNLAALPVVDDSGNYLGFTRRHDIFERFARMLSTQESGAVVSVEVEPRDFSLSKLVYAIEQNDVKILSIVSEMPEVEHEQIRLTLKLNVRDAARVRHMLEHFGYRVAASYGETEDEQDLADRVQAFMRYLDV